MARTRAAESPDLITQYYNRAERAEAQAEYERERAENAENLTKVWYQRAQKAQNQRDRLQQRIDRMTALIKEANDSSTWVDTGELKYRFDQI